MDGGLTAATPGQILQWNRGVSSRPEPPSAAILVVYLDRAQDLPVSVAPEGGRAGSRGVSTPLPPWPLPTLPRWQQRVDMGTPQKGPEAPQGRDPDESPPSSLKHKATKMVTSAFCHPQLKKGNKEPNPMVQLSTQDVTQESKVTARTRAPCGRPRVGDRRGTILGMKCSL